MGGDHGPEVVVPGAATALVRHPDLSFQLFGDSARIKTLLAQHPNLAARSEVFHSDLVIQMTDKPSQALRRGKGSSMWLALDAVREGKAAAAVSAGNTGALMAMAKLILRPISGIERPAIAAMWPTVKSECIVLDVGANIGADARQLCDFALMGAAMARALFHLEKPTVGLLNVGVEEIKGAEEVKHAHSWLKETEGLPIDYRGLRRGRPDRPRRRRRRRGRRLRRQYRAQDSGGHRPADRPVSEVRDDPHAAVQDRRDARPRRLQGIERKDGSAPRERRHVPRPQRRRDQEPRRHRRSWLCERDRSRLRHGRKWAGRRA